MRISTCAAEGRPRRVTSRHPISPIDRRRSNIIITCLLSLRDMMSRSLSRRPHSRGNKTYPIQSTSSSSRSLHGRSTLHTLLLLSSSSSNRFITSILRNARLNLPVYLPPRRTTSSLTSLTALAKLSRTRSLFTHSLTTFTSSSPPS